MRELNTPINEPGPEAQGDTAGAQADARILLSAEDFWRVRALIRDVEATELRFAKLRTEFEDRVRHCVALRDAALAELSEKYGLGKAGHYRFDDATCSVVRE